MFRPQSLSLPRVGPVFALAGLLAYAVLADERPRREFRRVDLGNGVWRVEVVPELDQQTEPGRAEPGRAEPDRAEPDRAEPGRAELGRAELGYSVTTNVQVTGWMLAEARQCLESGDLGRAAQLITWVSSLEFDWDRPQPATEQLRTELEALKFQLQFAATAIPSSGDPTGPVASDPQEYGPQNSEHRDLPSASESDAGKPQNALRQPRSFITTPSADVQLTVANETVANETVENETVENESVPTSTTDSDRPLPGSSTGAASMPQIVVAREPATGTDALVLPVNSDLFVVLVMMAFCGLLMAFLLGFLLVRRMTLFDREALRIAVEQATRSRHGPSAEAFRPIASVAAGNRDGDPARLDHTSLESGSADAAAAAVGWAKPDTFADQKKKVEIRHRQEESAMVQQIIARNVAIRKQFKQQTGRVNSMAEQL